MKKFKTNSSNAFTMAEILLSLTIIGVVAAITLPSLTGNINERTWNTQRKALYARISQAISLMPALNGFGTLKEESSAGASDAVDTATETFITNGLTKVLKINNICDNEHLADCGIVSRYTNTAGSTRDIPTTLYELNNLFSNTNYYGSTYQTNNTKAAAFETQNGESIVVYYNRSCKTEYLNEEAAMTPYGEKFGFPQAQMCANFIYDLNGTKGPNTIGKDIGFITVFNSIDSVVVAPLPSSSDKANGGAVVRWELATSACSAQNADSRLPNINELSAMLINKTLVNLSSNDYFSSSKDKNNEPWGIYLNSSAGIRHTGSSGDEYVRCIKR